MLFTNKKFNALYTHRDVQEGDEEVSEDDEEEMSKKIAEIQEEENQKLKRYLAPQNIRS